MKVVSIRHVVRSGALAAVALALVAAGACSGGEEEVRRQVRLTPASHLPEGTSEVDADHLSVGTSGLEPLAEGHYVAWAEWRASSHGPEALGAIAADGELTAVTPRDEEGRLADVVFVTEQTGGEPYESPSDAVRLRGAIGEALVVPGELASAVADSRGSVQLRGRRATVDTSGLPTPPAGMHYETWILWLEGGGTGEAHGDENGSHHTQRLGHGGGDAAGDAGVRDTDTFVADASDTSSEDHHGGDTSDVAEDTEGAGHHHDGDIGPHHEDTGEHQDDGHHEDDGDHQNGGHHDGDVGASPGAGHHEDGGHHDEEPGHAQFHDPATGAHHDVRRRVRIGRLGADGHLEHRSDEMLAAGHAVVISLESDRGVEDRSPITVMAGAVEFPDSGADDHGHFH